MQTSLEVLKLFAGRSTSKDFFPVSFELVGTRTTKLVTKPSILLANSFEIYEMVAVSGREGREREEALKLDNVHNAARGRVELGVRSTHTTKKNSIQMFYLGKEIRPSCPIVLFLSDRVRSVFLLSVYLIIL